MIELFSVYDMAAKRYMDPFPAPTIEFALRGFKDAVGTADHQFAKYPEDYSLFHVGTFDPELGECEKIMPHQIAKAASFIFAGPLLATPEGDFTDEENQA